MNFSSFRKPVTRRGVLSAAAAGVVGAGFALAAGRPAAAATLRATGDPGGYIAPFNSMGFRTIRPSDAVFASSTRRFQSIEKRDVFDRVVDKKVTKKMYRWVVTWTDGHQADVFVDTAIGGREQAETQVPRFAQALGRIPNVLRRGVTEIRVLRGSESFGGGDGILLGYNRGQVDDPSYFQGVILHEAAHTLGTTIYADPELRAGWKAAQWADRSPKKQLNGFICGNAAENPDREDVSASFMAWSSVTWHPERLTPEQRQFIRAQIPARISFFRGLGFDMRPMRS